MEKTNWEVPERKFLKSNVSLNSWEDISPYFDELLKREIKSEEDLNNWFLDKSELDSYLSENFARRYIKMTIDTQNESYQKNYQFFVQEIQPHLSEVSDTLNKKAANSEYINELGDKRFFNTIRSIKSEIEIFRDKNIKLYTEIQTKQTEYQAAVAGLLVNYNGEELTLQKAASYLKNPDRKERQDVWMKINEERYKIHDNLNLLFSNLLKLRNEVALNADFENFRDYMFVALGRFDYKPKDCFDFHVSIEKAVLPVLDEILLERKQDSKLDKLRPWDLKMDPKGRAGLVPFKSADELLQKTIKVFRRIDESFAEDLEIMKKIGNFDLESKKGKAPGGYNYPLEEIGIPFIFMNATNTLRDVVTLLHEGGHAVHSFESRNLPINTFKRTPAEVAELASMSMELISMEHWEIFFDNPEELKRAKIEHLEDIIGVLPWIATIDKFQHWVYENPQHTIEEREKAWLKVYKQFSSNLVDWEGLEKYKAILWQAQLHVFELPFYYIEYGMAQLGAIAIWKNYKNNPAKTIKDYKAALSLGYTKSIRDIYKEAGIEFDFSENNIRDLMNFVNNELKKLKN